MNFNQLAPSTTISKVSKTLNTNGIEAISLESGDEALAKIKLFIPRGASVMNGSSKTLEQIGFVEYLKSNDHGWNNLHAAVVAETDPIKRKQLRLKALTADFYLGSVHALTENGELIIASNTGSQLPHIVYSSPNLIFVVSTKKIVPTLTDGLTRLKEHVYPLEDANIMSKYNIHTVLSKIVILCRESESQGRKIRVIFVNEDLGF